MTALVEVAHIKLILIRLTLKRDIPVCLAGVPVLEQAEEVFDAVPNEEREYHHLLLLLAMNIFMVDEA